MEHGDPDTISMTPVEHVSPLESHVGLDRRSNGGLTFSYANDQLSEALIFSPSTRSHIVKGISLSIPKQWHNILHCIGSLRPTYLFKG